MCSSDLKAECGFGKERIGARYSFGYPACPDLSGNLAIFKLLEPEKYGVSLTQNYQMIPELTTCALISLNDKADYFNI